MAVVESVGVGGRAFVVGSDGVISWCDGSFVNCVVEGGLLSWYLGEGKGKREAVVESD